MLAKQLSGRQSPSPLASFSVFGGQFCAFLLLTAAFSAPAQWRVLSPSDQRQPQPPQNLSEGKAIKLGDACPDDQKFRWLVAEPEIPATIGTEPTAGKVVGL